MEKEFTITELETLLNTTQFLIDNLMREANINNINNLPSNQKLQKLTRYRTKIITQLEDKLDETFNREDKE